MAKQIEPNCTLDQLPRVEQDFRLACKKCGTRAVYDVGTIFYDVEGKGEAATTLVAFSNYFRCGKCQSAGPWEIDDSLKLLDLAVRLKKGGKADGIVAGRCMIFDGTLMQTPAIGEELLLERIKADPKNAFLYTRLGNLFRACRREPQAIEWYEKALILDPGDIEARYHLFAFAAEADDVPSAVIHAPLLAGSLLEGRTTGKEDLDEGVAFSLVDRVRSAPETFRRHFLGRNEASEGDRFIRTLLLEEGEEEDIRQAAVAQLIYEEEPPLEATAEVSGDQIMDEGENAVDLIPSLEAVVQFAGMDRKNLSVAFEANERKQIRLIDKHTVAVSDGVKMAPWKVKSLRDLFRGNQMPPSDIDFYPEAYTPYFAFIESQVLTICHTMGDRTDQEMEEIYSALARRPDGRSLGVVHDAVWQFAVLLLGRYPLSEAQFTALFTTLTRSTRKWGLRPVSRYYATFLRNTFHGSDDRR